MKNKKTYKFCIGFGESCPEIVSGNYQGKYYFFNNFKIYWAYRHHIAEQIDWIGVLSGTDKTATIRIHTNYAKRYE